MPRLNLRQFKRDISYVSDTLVFTPAVAVPSLAVGGVDVTASLQSNAAAVSAEKTRLDTLLDVGTSLDQITELRAAWESGDGTLTSAIAGLTSTAQTDRALIRTEFASADTALQSQITTNATDVDTLEATVNVTNVALTTHRSNRSDYNRVHRSRRCRFQRACGGGHGCHKRLHVGGQYHP